MPPFEHQKIYKLQSVAEGSFLDLHKGSTDVGNIIKTWEASDAGSQKWIVNSESHGFRIASVRNDKYDVMKVIDQGYDDFGRVLYYTFHGHVNQQWYTDNVQEDIYLIKNCWNDKALKSQGFGSPVKCSPADSNDTSQHWKIVPTTK